MTTARRRPANGADGRAACHAAFFPPSSPLLPLFSPPSSHLERARDHGLVPRDEPLARGRALVRGVAPEDEVVAALRRTGPEVRRDEAAAARPLEVGRETRHVAVTFRAVTDARSFLTRPAEALLLSSLSSLTKVAVDLEVRDEHFVVRDRARGARPEVLRQIGSNRQSNSRTTAHRTTAHRTESTTMIESTRDSIQSEWARGAEASKHDALVVVLRPFDDSERVCRDAMPPECSGRDEMRRGARALGHDTGFASRSADAAATGGASSAALRRRCVGAASALRRRCVGVRTSIESR